MTHACLATIIAAQMTARLPVLIDPLMYARKGLRIEGVLRVVDFERISDRLTSTDGDICVDLTFDMKDGQGVVEGRMTGELSLTCQRCAETMILSVDNDIRLGLVESEQEIEGLMSGYEPLMISEDPLLVRDLIEDEILLLLPMIPSHAQGECVYIEGLKQADEPVEQGKQEKKNPFSMLSELKKH